MGRSRWSAPGPEGRPSHLSTRTGPTTAGRSSLSDRTIATRPGRRTAATSRSRVLVTATRRSTFGEPHHVSAGGGHRVDLRVAVPLADERDPHAVRRPRRVVVTRGAEREPGLVARVG